MTQIRPEYYKINGKDLIDLMGEGLLTADETRGFLRGNILKYVVRYRQKNGVQDLRKAATYLDRLIQFENSQSLED